MEILHAVGSMAGALAFLATLAWASYAGAARLFPESPVSIRWAAAAVLAGLGLVGGFEVLTAVDAFRPDGAFAFAAMALGASLAFPASRAHTLKSLRADLPRVVEVVTGRGDRVVGAATAAVLVVAGVRVTRGLVAPPLAYDALTYHLARAATWVQAGAQDRFLAPDAWRYCTFYPAGGDALWAWALLPGTGDLLLAPAGLLAWAAALLGAYAGARALGAGRRAASLSALAIGSLPCILPHLAAAYVDLPTLAWLLLGFALVACHAREGRRSAAVLAVASLALAAATRSSALPWLALGLCAVAFAEARRDAPVRTRTRTVAACLAAALVAAPSYLGTWVDTGSPFYPVEVSVAGTVIFPGNAEFRLVHSGEAFGRERLPAPEIAKALFVPDPSAESPHLNLGPASPLLVLLGLLGAVRLLRRGPRAPAVLALAIAGVVLASTFLWPGSAGFLAVPWWLDKIGRFLAPAVAMAVVLGAVVAGRVADGVRVLAIATGLVLAFPLGWSEPDATATLLAAAILLAALVLAVPAIRSLARRRRTGAAWAVAIAVTLAATAGLAPLRAAARYPTWAAASRGEAYDLHPANARCLSAWPAWEALDGEHGARIALAAGFDGVGHNWYTYPLFGSRLQNRIEYVPATGDGVVPDYALGDALAPRLDRDAWLGRLAARGIDALVTLWPPPPEEAWALALPDVFVPLVETPGGRAFRVDPAALARHAPPSSAPGP